VNYGKDFYHLQGVLMKKDKNFFHGHLRLAEEREKLWSTQQEAADFFGVSRVTWGQCERGNATPSADVLAGLAQRGADVFYILTGVRSNTQNLLDQVHAASQAASRLGGTHQEQAHVAEAMVDKYQVVPLSPRQRALLDNWEHADEAGKKVIESTASFAAQPRAAQGGQ
jgi:DNA-binding XRE family transcriptional regulator